MQQNINKKVKFDTYGVGILGAFICIKYEKILIHIKNSYKTLSQNKQQTRNRQKNTKIKFDTYGVGIFGFDLY